MRHKDRPLGSLQKQVFDCLVEHGSWSRNCGWVWDTTSGTERVLSALVSRGLVEIVSEGKLLVYKPTGRKP